MFKEIDPPITYIVTGANGWLGQGLVNALLYGLNGISNIKPIQAQDKIRVLILPHEEPSSVLKHGNVEIIRGDITNKISCNEIFSDTSNAVLFHTAGVIHPRKVKEFYEVNLGGTQNIIDAAIRYHAKKAVIVSSNSPIGCNVTSEHVFDELSPFNPYMNYGKSKMLMEEHIVKTQERNLLNTVRIRTPWFYGPFQPPRQTLFFRMIKEGKIPIVGNGMNMRSMAYIDNLAQGLILAGRETIANGQVYWIADERPYSMNEVIDTIEEVLEKDFNIKCAGKRLRIPNIASDIAFFMDKLIQGTGAYHQKIHVLSEMNKNIACSVNKAKRELGYQPTIALREGMRRSIKWLIDNGETI